jgi:hypothetical protein
MEMRVMWRSRIMGMRVPRRTRMRVKLMVKMRVRMRRNIMAVGV